jgi:DNA-binding response OmpR family regulator
MAKLLVVDDENNLRLVVKKEMARQGHEVETASDGEAAWELLERQDFDVMLCDINMPRLDGMGLLRRLREKSQNLPEVIMLTGQATVETAIVAMKLGAYDYLTKPYRITELCALVSQAADKQKLKIDNQRLRAQVERSHQNMPEIVAESSQMKEVLRLVQRVAPSDTSVLISRKTIAWSSKFRTTDTASRPTIYPKSLNRFLPPKKSAKAPDSVWRFVMALSRKTTDGSAFVQTSAWELPSQFSFRFRRNDEFRE